MGGEGPLAEGGGIGDAEETGPRPSAHLFTDWNNRRDGRVCHCIQKGVGPVSGSGPPVEPQHGWEARNWARPGGEQMKASSSTPSCQVPA